MRILVSHPFKSPFSCKSRNIVLILWNTAFPLPEVNIWFQYLPRDGVVDVGLLDIVEISNVVLIAYLAMLLPLILMLPEIFTRQIKQN